MARPYRLQGENCFYHITSRGDDRKKIYISDFDFKKFLDYLLKAKERFEFHLYAYVLMSNHYHLLIETLQPNLSQIMQYLNTAYTTYYNVKRKKYGHLFQGRYKSILVDKDSYFKELSRYIHLNPVRARIVERPKEYKWSSYRGYTSKKGDGYIDKNQINNILDTSEAGYRQFVLDAAETSKFNPFKDIYAGFILGPASFIKEKLQDLKDQLESENISYKKALTRHISEEEIINTVAKRYGKTIEELCKSKKRPMKAKKIAIYLMKKLSNLTNNKIGENFGITYSAVSKATGDLETLISEDKTIKEEVEELISQFKA
jgi:putative transposase